MVNGRAWHWWNAQPDVPGEMLGVSPMGGGGMTEVVYRHFFELRHLLRIVPFDPAMAVLELGSGNGRWAVDLAPRVRRYTAVDFSTRAVAVARARFAAAGLDNVELHECSILDFSPRGPYDLVYFSGVSQYLRDDELARALASLAPHLAPCAWLLDRSTLGTEAREVVDEPSYCAVYRTADELAAVFATVGGRLLYRARSYQPLRFSRVLGGRRFGGVAATLARALAPYSLHALRLASRTLDAIRPVPFEGGRRTHDFMLFRSER